MSVLLIVSHHAETGYNPADPNSQRGNFAAAIEAGRVRPVWDWELTRDDFWSASGVITTQHLDQIAMLDWRAELLDLLARGGRIIFNGHVLRPLLPGLKPFICCGAGRREDLALTPLADHPVFDGVDRHVFQTVKGVAGFYGRGHNPPPPDAVALTGIGATCAPVDWCWKLPEGGAVLCHAGNDWWQTADDKAAMLRFAGNLVAWAEGTLPP
jgi:hypothetical protein